MRSVSIGARWAVRYSVATLAMLLALAAIADRWAGDWADRQTEAQVDHYVLSVSEIVGRHTDEPLVLSALIESLIAGSSAGSALAIEVYDTEQVLQLRRDILAPFVTAADFSEVPTTGFSSFTKNESGDRLEGIALNSTGFTRVSLSLIPNFQMMAAFRKVIGSLLLAGVVMTGFLGWWQARLSLRPISDIVESARKIDTAGGEQMLPTSGNGDELDILSETLNEMLTRIRTGMDRMRRFATQAAHELSTPLGASRTTIEVTLERDRTAQEYRAALHGLLANTELLSESVHAILDIARSEAGLTADRIEDVDLHDLLESVVEFFEPLAGERGIAMDRIRPFRAVVRGDRMWLHRMMASLLDNAVKYSQQGDRINFEYLERSGIAELSVRDSGMGIAETDRGRIFERFYRGDMRKSSSLGLGLPLAMEIARAHSGTIEVENPEPGGSIFRVCLPLASETRQTAA